MDYILNIETATEDCSVALSADGVLVQELMAEEKLSHATSLQPLIDKLFESQSIKLTDLSALAVSMGPGSYTGLRIGLSTAKGIAYALNIPLIGITTLRTAAIGAAKTLKVKQGDVLMPVIDARRMEVYAMLFDFEIKELQKASAIIMNEESLDHIKMERIIFSGNGAEKLKTLYENRKDCVFITDPVHMASNGIEEAWLKFGEKQYEDTA